MRKILLTLSISLTILAGSAQSWAPALILPTSNTNFNSVFFADANNGWAAGQLIAGQNYPIIFATTDGGQNWVQQSTPTPNAFIKSIFFIDSQTGWTAGTSGLVFKTINGGTTWTSQSAGSTTYSSVFFTSVNDGWIVGTNQIRRTTDGGSNWITQSVPNNGSLEKVYFTDALNGYIIGSSQVLKTTDGGNNWIAVSTNAINWRGIDFSPSNIGYLCGNSAINKTIDSGASWTNVASVVNGNINDIKFINDTTGIICQNGYIKKTINSGSAWSNNLIESNINFDEIFVVSPTKIIVVGSRISDATAVIYTFSDCNGAPTISSITGLSTSTFSPPCAGTTFTLSAGSTSDTFVWTLPGDWSITSGLTTNTITGAYGQTAGTVSVMATNSCNISTSYSSNIVTPTIGLPTAPTAINPTNTPNCLGANQGFGLTGSATSGNGYSWNWSSNEWIDLNSGSATLNPFGSFTLNSNSGSITVVVNNACGASAPYTQAFNFNLQAQLPVPLITQVGNTLTTTETAYQYCWLAYAGGMRLLGGNPLVDTCIIGSTGMSFVPPVDGDYTLTIATPNGCSTQSAVFVVTGTPVSIKENNALQFSIYPNPATADITLNNVSHGSTIKVIDVTGKLIYFEKVRSTSLIIETNNWSNGMYFIQIENEGAIAQKKLIINK